MAVQAAINPGYQALRETAAWMDLSSRGRLRITGEDRYRLMHAMTTNQVQGLRPGEGTYVFFLNAQGRILGDANLLCFEDYLLLDTEPETRAKLAEHLDRYIIADDVAVEDVTESTAAIGVEGPQAAQILASLGAEVPMEPHSWASWGARTVAKLHTCSYCVLTSIGDKSALIAQLRDIPEASPEDVRTVRIELGRPRYGEEITERYLVQETGQLQAISFSKGCYLGQEIVERVRSRAQIHRVLCRLEMDTDEVPPAGTKLKSGDAEAAEIASATFSPALGKVVALAYVRVPHNQAGVELLHNGIPAHVTPIS